MKKILILEDDFQLATDWREAFEEAGHHVIHCMTAIEAIDVFDQGGVDVFISDMLIRNAEGQTVDRQGGLSVMSHILLSPLARPRAIAVSGAHPSLNILKHAKALRADEVFVKPVAIEELLASIEKPPKQPET